MLIESTRMNIVDRLCDALPFPRADHVLIIRGLSNAREVALAMTGGTVLGILLAHLEIGKHFDCKR